MNETAAPLLRLLQQQMLQTAVALYIFVPKNCTQKANFLNIFLFCENLDFLQQVLED